MPVAHQSSPEVVVIPTVAPAPPPLLPNLASLTIRDALTPPLAGGTLAVSENGKYAVAADPDRDLVYVVSLGKDTTRKLQLPAGSEPGRIALDHAGRAHIVLRSAGRLARVELAAATLTLSEPLCEQPRGVSFDARRDAVLLSCADGQLLQLDPGSHALQRQQQLPRDLRDVIATPGARFVSRFRSAELRRLDPSGEVARVATPQPLPWPGQHRANGMRAPTARVIFTSANLAYRSVPAADGGVWMLHQRAQDDALEAPQSYVDGPCGPVVRPGVTRFDAQGEPQQSLQLHGPAALTVDLALSRDEAWLAVAAPSLYAQGLPTAKLYPRGQMKPESDVVGAGFPQENLEPEACSSPEPIALARDAQAVAVAFDGQGLLYVQSRVPARLDVVRPTPEAQASTGSGSARVERSISLADEPPRDLGHELFHANVTATGLSCAACHAEGQDDGRVWQAEETGPRRTPSLRGGLLETAPFHWDGSFALLDQQMNAMRTRRMGGVPLPSEALHALGQWLEKLPALRVKPQDELAAMRGKALFESADTGCVTCHPGPSFTNNRTLDVGTGAMQVPSLRGLALRAPYMHDGCATTLEDLFHAPCSGEHHGQTAQLDVAQRRDLLAYLESL